MLFSIRGAGAFLFGICLSGGIAHAQYADYCTFQPDCAVAGPTCAVATPTCAVAAPSCAVSCDTVCAPVQPRIRYKVSRPKPSIPSVPITYEVGPNIPCVNVDCTEIGCAPVACAPVVSAPVTCAPVVSAPVTFAPVGCADIMIGCDNRAIGYDNHPCGNSACHNDDCPGGAVCLAKHLLTSAAKVGVGAAKVGGAAVTHVGGAAIHLVGGIGAIDEDKHRRLSRNWYYKSFDRHRHLNYPIVSPAFHPTYGYNQTCWDRFPQEALWCPPCYGNAYSAADLYQTAPSVYPTAVPPTTPLAVPPEAPPARMPTEPPADPPAAPAASRVPTTSAALLYAP